MEHNQTGGRRALFLDRDGVINADYGYVHTPERTDWVDGIFDLGRRAQALGLALVVVTNQAGIARGYYTESQFQQYTRWMVERFGEQGIDVLAVYHCPHHPDFGPPCECRKPEPGMILRAARDHHLDLAQSTLLGDKMSDIQAADSAGIGLRVILGCDGVDARDVPSCIRVGTLKEAAAKLEEWYRHEHP